VNETVTSKLSVLKKIARSFFIRYQDIEIAGSQARADDVFSAGRAARRGKKACPGFTLGKPQ
jgi:hypothetical protein